MITVEDIGKTHSEEGLCKTRRTKWLSKKWAEANISKKASGGDATIGSIKKIV
ncbi:MAG: hypothetical protein QM528_08575 [Phycisphaerales bacterium]|nr:hypothetical protein [Phycisphaerales bacterium]